MQRRFQHAVDAPAEDALVRAGHAHVALKGGAAGQDLLVGRGHVGMRAQHGRHAAVQIAAHQLLVARGLGMEVDQDHFHFRRQTAASTRSARGKGAIDRPHEDPPQQAEHGHLHAVARAVTTANSWPAASGGKLAGLTMFVSRVQNADRSLAGDRCDRPA